LACAVEERQTGRRCQEPSAEHCGVVCVDGRAVRWLAAATMSDLGRFDECWPLCEVDCAESAYLGALLVWKIWISANVKQALHAKSTLPALCPAISLPNHAVRRQRQRHPVQRIACCICMSVARVDE
jgi:hypothetical protein